MSIKNIVDILKARYIVILSCFSLILLFAILLNEFILVPQYTSNAKLYVNTLKIPYETSDMLYDKALLNGLLSKDFKELIKSRLFAEKTAENLNRKDLTASKIYAMVNVTLKSDTRVLTLTATSPDKTIANLVCNEYAKVFAVNVPTYVDNAVISIVDEASAPTAPSSPNKRNNYISLIAFSLLLGITLSFFIDYLDRRVDFKMLTNHFELEGLLSVGKKTQIYENGDFFESFRIVRENIKNSDAKVFALSSFENNANVSLNFSYILSQDNKKVLLIDYDCFHSDIAHIFQKEKLKGFTDFISTSHKEYKKYIYQTEFENLYFMPKGMDLEGIGEKVNVECLKNLIDSLKNEYDYVIFHTSKVQKSADFYVIGKHCDQILLSVALLKTKVKDLNACVDKIKDFDSTKIEFLCINQTL